MTEEKTNNRVHGIVAEYTSVDSLLKASRRIRDAGYKKIDAFTPFPVHGIDEALGIKPTVLPWIALAGGLIGTCTALVMQIWMNSIDYPYIISGKPFISLPAFMPVAFELTVLFASFGAFFGMWALNGLPRFSNPMFTDPRFDRVTDDRFFLYIDAKDDRFDSAGVQKLLGETGTEYINSVYEDDTPTKIPKFIVIGLGVLMALSIIPALVVAKMRVTKSSSPRFHIFYDMDFSPAKDMQQTTTLFADGRAMRPDVIGTVARGQMNQDLDFMTGIDVEALSRMDMPRAQRLARAYSPSALAMDDPVADVPAAEVPAKPADEPIAEKPAKAGKKGKKKTAEDQPVAEDKPSEPKKEDPVVDEKPAEPAPAEKMTEASKPAEESATAVEHGDSAAVAPAPADAGVAVDTTPWLTENPLAISAEVLSKGQEQFDIYCAVCHGANGAGNGLVNQRAQKILATTWNPPSSLHDEAISSGKYPEGKLFSTITNGIRKMPGYGSQIKVQDRWAIVAYVRALQQSQKASIDLVPEDQRQRIELLKKDVDKVLAEQAEAEKQRAAEANKSASTP